jgi:hypothetical protein
VLLEEPVAQVDRQVDLVRFGDLDLVLLVLQVHRHELVADLRRVLSVVIEAEVRLVLLSLVLGLRLGLALSVAVLLLRLQLLLPADLVEALPKQDHVRQHSVRVELLLDLLGDLKQVVGEDLVHFHAVSVVV